MKNCLSIAAAISSSLFASHLIAAPIKPIPQESGISGSVILGVSAAEYSSNLIAGPGGDYADDTIQSLNDDPGSETNVGPLITGEVAYTFGQSRTQVFLGSQLEDLVTYDATFQLGARHELNNMGIVYGGLLFSGMATEVYADPYVTGTSRDETDRTSSGARIGWQRIMNTGVGVELTSREIEVDDEESGDQLVADGAITAAQQRLLDREGDQLSLSVNYQFMMAKGHLLVPEVSFHQYDLDGDAMSRDVYGAELAYFINTPKWSLITTVFYSKAEHDDKNPIYDTEEDVDNYGGSVVFTYNKIFDVENLSLFTSVAAAESDSNINFYDSDVITGAVGGLYKF